MQWLYLIGQGTVPTRVYFRCAALQQSARGYNARTYSQSKTDVSVQTVYKFFFLITIEVALLQRCICLYYLGAATNAQKGAP